MSLDRTPGQSFGVLVDHACRRSARLEAHKDTHTEGEMFGENMSVVFGFLLVLVGVVWSIIVVAGKRNAYGALVASGLGLILLIGSGALARMEGGFMVGLLAGLAGLGLSIFALARK